MGFGFIFGLSSRAIDEGPVSQSRSGVLTLTNDTDLNQIYAEVALNLVNNTAPGLRLGRNKIQAVGTGGSTTATLILNPKGGNVNVLADVQAASFIATSSREKKTNILPYEKSALELINQTQIVSFNYKADPDKKPYVGFISEDTPSPLATPDHKEMSINSCIGLLLKAVQELDKKIEGVSHA